MTELGRDYARQPYLDFENEIYDDESYVGFMKRPMHTALQRERLRPYSEFKKPYLANDYPEMERWGDLPYPFNPFLPEFSGPLPEITEREQAPWYYAPGEPQEEGPVIRPCPSNYLWFDPSNPTTMIGGEKDTFAVYGCPPPYGPVVDIWEPATDHPERWGIGSLSFISPNLWAFQVSADDDCCGTLCLRARHLEVGTRGEYWYRPEWSTFDWVRCTTGGWSNSCGGSFYACTGESGWILTYPSPAHRVSVNCHNDGGWASYGPLTCTYTDFSYTITAEGNCGGYDYLCEGVLEEWQC